MKYSILNMMLSAGVQIGIQEDASYFADYISGIESLCYILGMFAIGVYIAKRFSKNEPVKKTINVVERTKLSPRTTVHLCEIGEEKFIFTTGSEEVGIHYLSRNHFERVIQEVVEGATPEYDDISMQPVKIAQ